MIILSTKKYFNLSICVWKVVNTVWSYYTRKCWSIFDFMFGCYGCRFFQSARLAIELFQL